MTIPALALFMLAAIACAAETATPPAVQISPATMPPTAAPTPDLVGTITAAIAATTAAQPTPTPTPSPAATPTLLAVWNRFRASQVSLCLGIDLWQWRSHRPRLSRERSLSGGRRWKPTWRPWRKSTSTEGTLKRLNFFETWHTPHVASVPEVEAG